MFVTMTREQWNKLTCYLLMSTQHREKEAKAWAELSEEKAEDGSPKYWYSKIPLRRSRSIRRSCYHLRSRLFYERKNMKKATFSEYQEAKAEVMKGGECREYTDTDVGFSLHCFFNRFALSFTEKT